MEFIYPFWREHYFFRIVLLVFNSLLWGIAIRSGIVLLKKTFNGLKKIFIAWYKGN